MRELVQAGAEPGILGYLDGEPVAGADRAASNILLWSVRVC